MINDPEDDYFIEDDDIENIIKEKSHAKNTQIIYNHIKNNNEDRVINVLKNIEEKNECNVLKFMDINNCIKDDYFNFSDKKLIITSTDKDKNDKFIPIDKNFRIHTMLDKNKFTSRMPRHALLAQW